MLEPVVDKTTRNADEAQPPADDLLQRAVLVDRAYRLRTTEHIPKLTGHHEGVGDAGAIGVACRRARNVWSVTEPQPRRGFDEPETT